MRMAAMIYTTTHVTNGPLVVHTREVIIAHHSRIATFCFMMDGQKIYLEHKITALMQDIITYLECLPLRLRLRGYLIGAC